MNLFIMVLMLFVVRTFVRNLEILREKQLLYRNSLTKIGTAYVLWVIFGMLFAFTSHILLLWFFIPILFLSFSEFFIRKRRQNEFHERLLPFLNRLIMQMHVGKSFREAFQSTISKTKDNYLRDKLEKIYEFVVFSQHNEVQMGAQVDQLIEELRAIDRQSHRCIQRATALRDKLSIVSDFRRRSGQVLQQLRLQSLIMSVLYFAILIFVISQYGFRRHFELISASAVLFVIGVWLVFVMGRRIKWKF